MWTRILVFALATTALAGQAAAQRQSRIYDITESARIRRQQDRPVEDLVQNQAFRRDVERALARALVEQGYVETTAQEVAGRVARCFVRTNELQAGELEAVVIQPDGSEQVYGYAPEPPPQGPMSPSDYGWVENWQPGDPLPMQNIEPIRQLLRRSGMSSVQIRNLARKNFPYSQTEQMLRGVLRNRGLNQQAANRLATQLTDQVVAMRRDITGILEPETGTSDYESWDSWRWDYPR